jgi:hypothetical protein
MSEMISPFPKRLALIQVLQMWLPSYGFYYFSETLEALEANISQVEGVYWVSIGSLHFKLK